MRSRTRKRLQRLKFLTLILSFGVIVFTVGAEVWLRVNGNKPYRYANVLETITPSGKLFRPDSSLGFKFASGTYKITEPSKKEWTLNIGSDGFRVTSSHQKASQSVNLPSIWIFGCEYGLGWGVSDRETFAWDLQQRFPEFEFKNMSVGRYSTLQSVISYREELKKLPRPQAVLLAYSAKQDERNTLSRRFLRSLETDQMKSIDLLPYATMGSNDQLDYHRQSSFNLGKFLAGQSSVLAALENKYSLFRDAVCCQNHRVSEAIVDEFARESHERGITFGVMGMNDSPGTAQMMEYANKMGIPFVDLSSPLTRELDPFALDSLPDVDAHRVFADRMEVFMKQGLFRTVPATS